MRSIPFALLFTILAANTLLPQQKPQQKNQQGAQQAAQPSNAPAKFGTTLNLVVEDVFVKDKNGKPIEGLTEKDFVVTEDNAPQTLMFCQFQKLEDTVLPPAAPVTIAPPIPTADAPKAPPVDPLTRVQIAPETPGDLKYRNRRLLALYFDMTSMPIPDQLRALDSAQKFVTKQMKSADLLSIIKYDGEAVRVLQDFTDDRDLLMKSINKMAVGEGSGLDELTSDADASDTGSAFGEDDSEFNLFNTNRQLAALQNAVKMLSTLNEKKVLIFFASGLSLNGVDNQAQFQATTNAAIRANVTFWTIDARGLVAISPMGDATRGSAGGAGMYTGAAANAMMNRFQASQDTLFALATDTGGKALLDTNDLSKGIEDAEASISSYYILGYNTTNTKLDGKFRRIKISLKEDPTAKVEYRQGYFANKTFDKFTTSDKERQLMDALMLPDPITDLNIALEVNWFQLNGAEYFNGYYMKIAGSELALARKSGAERTTIDFIGEVKDPYGSTVGNIRDHVDRKLTGETAEQLARSPLEYSSNLVLLPGTYTIKVLARDDETGRIGTYIKTYTVPNIRKEETRIPISSVVLGSQRIDMRDVLYNANKDKTPSTDPLLENGVRLLPSINRVFSRKRDMFVFLQAYEKDATAQRPLVAFVTFYRGQTKMFETPPLGVTEGMDPKSKAIPMRFSLSLSKLPPGRYDCQVTVLDPTTQKVNFWKSPVQLVD